MDKILEMHNIRKEFPGVKALDDVDLELMRGEILALLGENGAGKSTLMKILAGAIVADGGQIILEGENIQTKSPFEMLAKGISVVYQELNYLDDLTIAENIFIGNLPKTKFGAVDYKKLKMETRKLLELVGLEKDPMMEVGCLSIAEKQIMEIAKALSKDSKVLVMDEPTSALNETEANHLFVLLKNFVKKGNSVIYISHKMEEIFEISNRVQVLRDGKNIGTRITQECSVAELVNMMVGRSISNMYPKKETLAGDVVLEIKDVSSACVRDVSFQVKAGEIVGMFGLLGSGRTEIVECLFGKRCVSNGEVYIDGEHVKIKNPASAIKAGIAYLPRERKSDGLLMLQDVKKNMTVVYQKKLRKLLQIDFKEEKRLSKLWVEKLNIKTPGINTPVESLSGGNQQKVAISKWLMNGPKILILNEPTRGIDVGAKVEIYKLIEELCENGMAIILISSETPEIMGISDRILVVHEGTITGEIKRKEFDQERIMHLAIGGE